MRTPRTESPDGYSYRYSDAASESQTWELQFRGLGHSERQAIEDHFKAAEGRHRPFAYVDPAGNLLLWSEDLSAAVWNKGPLLQATPGYTDPMGGSSAWRTVNTSVADQRLTQILNCPQGYTYCFSAYVRSDVVDSIRLVQSVAGSSLLKERSTGPAWRRVWLSGAPGQGGEGVEFGLELAAGSAVEVFGLQVDAQPNPAVYRRTTNRGALIQNARYADDSLQFTATDNNCFETTIRLTVTGIHT
ncbi:MAG: hypothetical protein SFV54_20960 [Bryobacteraceae bacterium]|nr:hypothetical protein [Bryobacteraceae bacterium]